MSERRRVHHGKVLNNWSRVHGELWCYVGEVLTERIGPESTVSSGVMSERSSRKGSK